jgi:hypothetical protein
MKVIYVGGVAIAIVFSIGFMIALGPMLPLVGWITFGLIWLIAAGMAVVIGRRYWIKGTVELLNAQKIHADNSAILMKNQILALPAGNIGYGTISNLHTYRADGNTPGMLPLQQQTQIVTPQLPLQSQQQTVTAEQAVRKLQRDSLSWFFGVDENGQDVTAKIEESVHVLNVAGSGQGKTTLTANLLYQLVMCNDSRLYRLMIADIKGTLVRPFQPWCNTSGMKPNDYVTIIQKARNITEKRMAKDARYGTAKGEDLVLIVLEEALAVRAMMDESQLESYSANLNIVATNGREYGVFLLACAQIDYTEKAFRVSKALFMTRLAGAFPPTAANSMGFYDYPLVKRLWQEKKRGQFMLEGPDGSRLFQVPRLDMKNGELDTLLQAVIRPAVTPVTEDETENYIEVQLPLAQDEVRATAYYYNNGWTTARQLAAKMTEAGRQCGKDKALRLIEEAKRQGLINE